MDGRGSLLPVDAAMARLAESGARIATLTIAPLSEPWDTPEDPNRAWFKSGCAPILALERAREILDSHLADAVLIRGEDALRSGYSPAKRRAAMDIWPDLTIPEAYTALARHFMAHHGISRETFRVLADALLENYQTTALPLGLSLASPESRHAFVTDLFTLADCAHPVVDFQGAVVLGGHSAAAALAPHQAPSLELRGIAVERLPDGPEHAEALAGYAHLGRAFRRLSQDIGEDLAGVLRRGGALMEAYTCFPPVPLGFLLATGVVDSPEGIPPWLAEHAITVTGGMNLARAPWNNPVLRALVVMADRLVTGGPSLGLLHGNGGLGGLQGFALLAVTPEP